MIAGDKDAQSGATHNVGSDIFTSRLSFFQASEVGVSLSNISFENDRQCYTSTHVSPLGAITSDQVVSTQFNPSTRPLYKKEEYAIRKIFCEALIKSFPPKL